VRTGHQGRGRIGRLEDGQFGNGKAAAVEGQGEVPVEEGDGRVDRDELRPVPEGRLDLDLVEEGGDAGEYLPKGREGELVGDWFE